MAQYYPEFVLKRYKLDAMPETATALLEEVGRRRGCLVSGGEIDLHRAAEAFLRVLRGGMLGRVSLEAPGRDSEAAGKRENEEEGV
jgi:ribosome biogenesis GTPase A